MDGIAVSIALVLLFVLIGGYFSASELALVSLRDSQVERLARMDRRGAGVARLRKNANRFLAAVQIGVTLAGFFSAAYGGSTLVTPLAQAMTGWGLPGGLADVVALIVVTGAISYVSLIFGELVPKRLALQRAEGVALFVAPVLDRVAALFRPFIWLLSRSTNAVVRLIGLDPGIDTVRVTEEELRDMVSGHEALSVEERRVLTEVFAAADRQVREIMVPRTEVQFLSAATPLAEAARQVLDRPISRYPVIGEDVDDVVGFVHVRDLLTAQLGAKADVHDRTVGELMRPVQALPASKHLLGALAQMRASRSHLAVVIDEYGGTAGIVTMEDVFEELVGEIEDEFDRTPRKTPAALLDGLMHRDDVRERCGIVLPEGPFETLGGFVLAALGRVPAVGDTVDVEGRQFTVTEMDGHRVAAVRVSPLPRPDGDRPTPERPPAN